MHDFKRFPELRNEELAELYFESPHKQIFEDFDCKVSKVLDGDTIKVKWSERDFEFRVRFLNISAPELKDEGGHKSKSWLEKLILGQHITIGIDPNNRVGKWGRLLGYVMHNGLDVGQQSILAGQSQPWNLKDEGIIDNFERSIASASIKGEWA